MIKLKDIVTESNKVELHKVITDKTEPAFMTEEQWNAKWSKKGKLDEVDLKSITLGMMTARLVYNIVSGYLSVNPDKAAALKRFISMGAPKSKVPKK